MAADETFWESFWPELHRLRGQSLPSGMRLDELLAVAAFYPVSKRQQEEPPLVDARDLIRDLRLGGAEQAVMDALRRYEAAKLVRRYKGKYEMDSRVRAYFLDDWPLNTSTQTIDYLWQYSRKVMNYIHGRTLERIRAEVGDLKRELGIVNPSPYPNNLMNYQAELRERAKRK